MWAATSTSPGPCCRRLPISTRPPPSPPVLAIHSNSQPPRTDAEKTTPDNDSKVKTLGHTILSAVKSTDPKSPHSNRKPKARKPESEVEAAAGQISGSDVLWALQKAAAVKEKNRNRQVKDKKKEVSSTEGSDEEKSEMSRRVRPLRIKSGWSLRLSELEKRLQEISETV